MDIKNLFLKHKTFDICYLDPNNNLVRDD